MQLAHATLHRPRRSRSPSATCSCHAIAPELLGSCLLAAPPRVESSELVPEVAGELLCEALTTFDADADLDGLPFVCEADALPPTLGPRQLLLESAPCKACDGVIS